MDLENKKFTNVCKQTGKKEYLQMTNYVVFRQQVSRNTILLSSFQNGGVFYFSNGCPA